MNVVVIGAGMGGLATAVRRAAAGDDVTVLERRDRPGGKLDHLSRDGFRFETGPSLLTAPGVFAELFADAGARIDDHLDLVRLDPICRYRFADGSSFDTRALAVDTEAAVDAFSPGAGRDWDRFNRRGGRIWEVAERTFFAGDMSSPRALLGRLRSPRDLVAIDARTTLHDRARMCFADPRLVQYVDRYATYSGSSPFAAPATLSCIAHVEQTHGAWYVMGGIDCLATATARLATSLGVDIRYAATATRILEGAGAVRGVETDRGEQIEADIVVANVDAALVATDLLPDADAARRIARAEPSTSAQVLLLGVTGETEGLAHHNVSFSADYRAEFDALFTRHEPARDPTVYVGCSARTDPTVAPAGHENWFVLVNVPAASDTGPAYGDHVLDVMAARGWDLSGRVVAREEITPAVLAERYASPGGSIYGSSSNGARAAFARPPNRGWRRGLYLVGGTSHPGGGLPLVTISARIVSEAIDEDHP